MNSKYTVDQQRWDSLNIFDQMGNIYSEVGRSFKTSDQPNATDHEEAIKRALDLFDATTNSLLAKKSPKLKELLRAKEQFLDLVYDPAAKKESIKSLDRYFMQFAVAARLKH